MTLPEFGVKRPVTTTMIFLALAVLAVICVRYLSIDLFPEIEPPAISVITAYPGATAIDVEGKVTRHIENELSIVNNLDEIRSVSKENLSVVTCKFTWSANIDEAANDIRDRLEFAKPKLPDDAEDPVIFKFNTSMFPVLVYGVSAREHWEGLYTLVDKRIAAPLKRVPGVGAVNIIGGLERQVNVVLDRDKMEAYRISIDDISRVLAAENITMPAGSIKVGRSEYTLRVPGEFTSPGEVADTVIKRTDGSVVYLRDIASVSDSFKEQQMRIRADGGEALAFFVQKRSGTNTVQVSRDVEAKLGEIERTLPSDVKITLVQSQADFVLRSIYNLRNSAILGVVLVVFVTYLFLRDPWSSMIIAVTIPVSMLAALLFMYLLGYTINVMTLFALAMASGMVVDNAVVILENVTRLREGGRRASEAAWHGASEVGLAVSASTLTTVIIFVPLFFLKGIVGILFNQLGVVITVTLMMSLFTALTLTPMMCSKFFRKQIYIPRSAAGRAFFSAGERALVLLESGYYRLIGWALAHKGTVLLAAVLLMALAFAAATKIGSEFFPEEDVGSIRVTAELPVETRVEESERLAREMERIFRDTMPVEMEHVFMRTGTSAEGFASVMGGREGSNIIEMSAKLVPVRRRRRSSREIAALLSDRLRTLPGVVKLQVDAGNPMQEMLVTGQRPLSVEIIGHDLEATDRIAGRISDIVRTTPGTRDTVISRSPGKPELLVEVDRRKASSLGLNVAAIGQTLRAYFYGRAATQYREGGEEYDVFLRLQESQRANLADVSAITVTNINGEPIPLPNFARITESLGPAEIERLNQERLVTVGADVNGRSLGEVSSDVEKRIAQLPIPADVEVAMGGLVKEQRESFFDLWVMLAVGTALVYMVMAAQFESLVHPFVIMFSVPFAFVGVAYALYLCGYAMSVATFIGIIMLVGIVVNNAIVLVDYVNLLRARGFALEEAVKETGRRRLRPVLITTITTLFGLMPLAVSRGEGAEVMRPLGTTVIGGLAFSTLVTLVLVPVVYAIVEAYREKRKAAREGAK